MKIRYLIMSYFRLSGAVRSVLGQAKAMAAAGHDVEVIGAVRDSDTPFFPLPDGVGFSTLIDTRQEDPADGPGVLVPKGEAKYDVFTRRVETAVADYLAASRDGTLVTTRVALNLLSARYSHRSVVRVGQEHVHLARHEPDVHDAIVQHYPNLDAVTTLTEADRLDYTSALGSRAPMLVTIPNFLHRDSLADDLRSRLDRPVVVAAGRLSRPKGFDLLIKAFERVVKRNHNWQLRICGEGAQEGRLRKLVDGRGLRDNVQLLGAVNDIDSELAEASLFVVSSRWEGFSLVLIEAMACGLPVVSFDCPRGPREIIRSSAEGTLVKPENVPALARAMSRLIRSERRRRKMGEAAFSRAADFLPSRVVPRWEELFEQLSRRRSSLSEHGA